MLVHSQYGTHSINSSTPASIKMIPSGFAKRFLPREEFPHVLLTPSPPIYPMRGANPCFAFRREFPTNLRAGGR